MEGKELFALNRIIIGLEAQDREDAIEQMCNIMKKEGMVKESFLENILAREARFPTGLKIGDYGIAIPHTDPEHVNCPGITVATLKNKVEFQRMDDPDAGVEAEIIFMMALKDGHNHLEMIGNIIKMLQNKEILSTIINAKEEHNIMEAIQSTL